MKKRKISLPGFITGDTGPYYNIAYSGGPKERIGAAFKVVGDTLKLSINKHAESKTAKEKTTFSNGY